MSVLNAALQAADPYLATLRLLNFELDIISNLNDGKGYVVGAGKAGEAMARAAEEVLGERIASGLVVVKEGYTGTGGAPLSRVMVCEAGHPVPDERGVSATTRLLEIVNGAQSGDLVICLISGGGSALLTAPAEGISLEDVQETTRLLLRSGATINELNAVRKHLSRISGGQLARAAAPAHVLSLILSDVTGSPLDVIASGPTAPDPTTYADALGIIERYGLLDEAPGTVLARLQAGAAGEVEETPKPGDALFDRVTNRLVASNVIAVEAAADYARILGLDTLIGTTFLEGEAREIGSALAGVAKEIVSYGRPVSRPGCVLFGGETTVTVRGEGVGGRNTELALGAALALEGWGPDVVVASLATDGGDGTSPSAGAIADGTTIDRGKSLGIDAHSALARNDSYSYWHELGDAIMTGPTGTNVNDMMAVFAF
ncbi:MAG TPA: glycerate kinase [Chloroflexia bacterium]|nr:glycerate kinase [Chloroflexia bacterium]